MASETSKKALGESLDVMVGELGKGCSGASAKPGRQVTPRVPKDKTVREDEAKKLQKTIKMLLSKND